MNDQADENQENPEDQHVCFESDVDAETSNQFYDLIREAEAKSYELCECCGQPARLTRRGGRGWFMTLCSACSGKLKFEPVGDSELD